MSRKTDPALLQQLTDLAHQGKSGAEISEIMGKDKYWVGNWCSKLRLSIKRNNAEIVRKGNQKRQETEFVRDLTEAEIIERSKQLALSLGVDNSPKHYFKSKEQLQAEFGQIKPINKAQEIDRVCTIRDGIDRAKRDGSALHIGIAKLKDSIRGKEIYQRLKTRYSV